MMELQKLTLMSLNISCFNIEEKQQVIGNHIHQNEFHLVCLNETDITITVYFDNFSSHKIKLQRNGGIPTEAINQVKLTIIKALDT
jgi:hypothetical protein